jgi:hypothetical protein
MKKYILLFALALIGSSSFLQDVPFEKDLFKERKDEFKLAVENIETGDANVYAYNYPLAVILLLKSKCIQSKQR